MWWWDTAVVGGNPTLFNLKIKKTSWRENVLLHTHLCVMRSQTCTDHGLKEYNPTLIEMCELGVIFVIYIWCFLVAVFYAILYSPFLCVVNCWQMENQVIVSDYTQMDRVLREERNYILDIVKKIKKVGCNVLLIQKSILRSGVIYFCF